MLWTYGAIALLRTIAGHTCIGERFNRCFWGDKMHCNKEFFEPLEQEKKFIMLSPVKAVKGQRNIYLMQTLDSH